MCIRDSSYIKEEGAGSLLIWSTGTEVKFLGGTGAGTMVDMNTGGSVDLYHNDSKKFETTAAGATVTGDLTVSTDLQVNGGDITTASGDLTLNPAGVLRSGSTINLGNNNVYDFPNGSDWTSGSLNILATNITLDGDGKFLFIKGGGEGTSRTGVAWTFSTADTRYAEISLDYDTRGTVGIEHRTSHYPISFDAGYSEANSDFINFKVNQAQTMKITANVVTLGTTAAASPSLIIDNDNNGTGVIDMDSLTSDGGSYGNNRLIFRARSASDRYSSIDYYDDTTLTFRMGIERADNILGSSGAAGDFVLGNVTNKPIRFFTNNLERMAITGSGRVGIGTTSPDYDFEVETAGAEIFAHYSGNSRGGIKALSSSRLSIMTTAVLDDIVFGYSDTAPADNGSDFTERMRIDNGTGNVGVGVAAPDQKLEVAGAIHISGEVSSPSAPSDGDGGIMYTKTDGKLYYISNEVAEVEVSSSGGGGGTGTAIAMALVFGSTYS